MRRGAQWMLTLAGIAGSAVTLGAQQTSVITGTVTDRASGQPLPAAQVQVVGTTRGAATGDNGQYRLAGLPAGPIQVRVLRIGYRAVTRPVTVVAGQNQTVDFQLEASAVSLDQVVVTATGEQVRRREQGNAVSSIAPNAEEQAATTNLTDVLNSRTPGVYVQQSSGTTGTGSRVRIRGANSLSLSNEPLLVVDGIRANNAVGGPQGTTNVGTGGQVISRLNDINPEDIESIEVIKGPAGVAIYGTAAANGVIQITTKKGRSGRTQWNGYVEGGALNQDVELPMNYGGIGTATSNGARGACTIDAVTRGVCRQTEVKITNPSAVDPIFRDGDRLAVGLNAAGGSERLTYFAGGDFQQERGVQEVSNDRRMNLRANFRGELRPSWDLTVNSGYVSDYLQLPVNDNSTIGYMGVTLLGRANASDTLSGGFLNGYTPTELENIRLRQNIDRFITSTTTNWQAQRWLSFSGVAGIDYLQQTTRQAILPNRVRFGDLPQGSANSNPYSIYNWTAQGNANANFSLTDNITSQTQIGAQYARELYRGTQAFGAVLAPGTGSLAGTSARFSVTELNTDNITLGVFAQQRFGWRDRVFLNAGIRGDRNSAFGSNFSFVYYPTANLSYVISEEDFFPTIPGLSSLQLRAAWGRSGQRPTFRDALTYYSPVAVRTDVAGSDVPAITFTGAGVGDVTLKPETSTETEIGFDAGFLDGRINATLTYYNKTTDDLLIRAPFAPSVGAVATQFRNLGSLDNSGFEFQIGGTLYRSRPVTVDLTFGGNTNKNELTDIGGVAPITVSTQQQHRPGYPAGGFWQRPYTFADANGDGMIARTEIQWTADTAVYMGNPLPTREYQLQPALTIFENLRLQALFSYRGGFKVLNSTTRFRCAFSGGCREANDPTAPLADQARYIAAISTGGSDYGYVEDGDFARLREVAATFTIPQRWARTARVSNASFTIAGRNLATWTDYSGLDPEITSTPGNNWASSEFLTVPPIKIWTARVNLSF